MRVDVILSNECLLELPIANRHNESGIQRTIRDNGQLKG